jgi:cytochrome c5
MRQQGAEFAPSKPWIVRRGKPMSTEDNKHWQREGEPVPVQKKNFVLRFSLVVVGLHVLLAGIAGLAYAIDRHTPAYEERRQTARAFSEDEAAERIAPVGQVVTDPARLVALAPPPPAHAPLTGAQVVTQACAACHQAGVLGAPKIGDAGTWQARAQAVGGVPGLVQSAIKGKNQMPPRGGRPDLTDAEIEAAVREMAGKV